MTRKHTKFRTLQKRNLRAEQLEDRKMMDASSVLAEAEWTLPTGGDPTLTEPPPMVCGDSAASTPVSANHGGPVKPHATVFRMVGVHNNTTFNSPAVADEVFAAVAKQVEGNADCGGGRTATGFGQYQQAVDAVMSQHAAAALVPQVPRVEPIIEPSYESRGDADGTYPFIWHEDPDGVGTIVPNGLVFRAVGVENDSHKSPATGEPNGLVIRMVGVNNTGSK